MEFITHVFEIMGVAIIAIGFVVAIIATSWKHYRNPRVFFAEARDEFGRPLILGLEVLVAADIIETITVERTLESAAALGILVVVRILLSFALDVEIEGMWPWKRAEWEAAHEEPSTNDG